MLRLLLLRHAKSAWADPGLKDIDRPLAPRGRRAAGVMGQALAREEYHPDRILCSPARRTRETLAELLPHLGEAPAVAVIPALYEPAGDYRDAIAEHGDGARRLLVIGHNPAIQATAVTLIGAGNRPLIAEIAAKFPTAALAAIDFDADSWNEIAPRKGRLAAFLTPRSLAAAGDDVGDD